MKDKLWAIFFAIIIAVVAYTMVSSAARHSAADNAALYKWRLSWADRR